jgi:hypothetical protein
MGFVCVKQVCEPCANTETLSRFEWASHEFAGVCEVRGLVPTHPVTRTLIVGVSSYFLRVAYSLSATSSLCFIELRGVGRRARHLLPRRCTILKALSLHDRRATSFLFQLRNWISGYVILRQKVYIHFGMLDRVWITA